MAQQYTHEGDKRRLTCPNCGHSIYRSHRTLPERVTSLIRPARRYKCSDCGWSGLIPVRHSRHSRTRLIPNMGRKARQRLIFVLVIVLLALIAALIAFMLSTSMAAQTVAG